MKWLAVSRPSHNSGIKSELGPSYEVLLLVALSRPHSSLVGDSIESDRWRRGARRARARDATTTTGRRRRRTGRVKVEMDVSSCASRRDDDDDEKTMM